MNAIQHLPDHEGGQPEPDEHVANESEAGTGLRARPYAVDEEYGRFADDLDWGLV